MPAANYEPEMRVDKLENRVKRLLYLLRHARGNVYAYAVSYPDATAHKALLDEIDKELANDRTQPHEA